MSDRLVLFFHFLEAVFQIATRPNQVLFGVIQFILIQLELRFSQVQLVAQRLFSATSSFGFLLRELRHESLIFFQ